ncbi:HET domain-containing protein [Fusarium sp. LHS14.1]|nr:HET domain-containing protein [Fusarium sp. LHS14.1]
MVKTSHLCATCIYALGHPLDNRKPGPHHLTLDAIRQAVEEGCYICSEVWKLDEQGLVIRWDKNKAVDHEHDLPAKYTTAYFGWDFGLMGLFIEDDDDLPPGVLLMPKGLAEKVYGPFPPLDDRTSSLRSLDQASDWLTSCCVRHLQCSALSKREPWLPTRLIDVGLEGDDTWKLRVVAEDDVDWPTPYVTLSYRWGTEPSIMLLKSNMDEFRRGKPIANLPQTFQDLITVTRHFSHRYVWIDALCIIQDSSQDWLSESVLLRDVYANSICTIAAAASSGHEGGLFRLRQPEQACPGVVNVAYGDEAPEDFYIWSTEYWLRHFDRSEIHTRGWIF